MLKIVSLNVESSKHLPLVKEFLEKESADVVALMEVCEENLEELLPNYPFKTFAPNFKLKDEKKVGVVIASKTKFVNLEVFYGDGEVEKVLNYEGTGDHRPTVVIANWVIEGKMMTIGATHYTWTPDGLPTTQEKEDVARLIQFLGNREIVLCGDFNIPRDKNELYGTLAAKYKDNIPVGITSTIDPNLHRINKQEPGKLALVVDYMWSTPGYRVENLKVESGVSDHCALVADIV